MLPCASRDAGLEPEVAKRIVMAAWMLRRFGGKPGKETLCFMPCYTILSFAAGHRKLYWNGCIKSARVICQLIFSILALMIFPLKLFLKSASKSCFFSFGVEIQFWSCNF